MCFPRWKSSSHGDLPRRRAIVVFCHVMCLDPGYARLQSNSRYNYNIKSLLSCESRLLCTYPRLLYFCGSMAISSIPVFLWFIFHSYSSDHLLRSENAVEWASLVNLTHPIWLIAKDPVLLKHTRREHLTHFYAHSHLWVICLNSLIVFSVQHWVEPRLLCQEALPQKIPERIRDVNCYKLPNFGLRRLLLHRFPLGCNRTNHGEYPQRQRYVQCL